MGATGYAGFELAKLLLRHPRMATPLFLSREQGPATQPLESLYPELTGNESYPLVPFSWDLLKKEGVDVLFLATPHELSRELVPEAMGKGLRIVDLSGAWRLKDPVNRGVYRFEDKDAVLAAELDRTAIYGLPELHRDEIRDAVLVANPGCYATSVIVPLTPLVRSGLVNTGRGVVCDCKSGVSGAGKKPTQKTHFVEAADNFSAYSVFGHRHTGEILEQAGLHADELIFTPHLLPIPRGILSTIYLGLTRPVTPSEIDAVYRESYSGSHWVRIFGPGKLPQIQYSVRTNYCDVGFELAPDGKRLIVVSCLDNLMKGAAGQALQNLNVMFGWSEKEGF
ncbi:MAG: N-acetyl-gamma-glutamyl-phosphate reductase [Acidobacteria bacterium]|nr:MAG: N-acetyl-gamma-glutamyl-phosphate reductase [Acidobacteriota bacterium]